MNFDSFVLAAATADLEDAGAATPHADAVEFRMDMASAPLDAIERYDGSLPIIATNRVVWEGGDTPDVPARLESLAEAARSEHVGAVDVELAALEGRGDNDAGEIIEVGAANDVAVIVSTHDFETTPSRDEMADRLELAAEYGDVGKLAVTAQNPDDVLDLLRITREVSKSGHHVASMAMGEAGRHSRAVAPLYGSKIGYAPVDPAGATAPGQYDLATLRGLIDDLQSRA